MRDATGRVLARPVALGLRDCELGQLKSIGRQGAT